MLHETSNPDLNLPSYYLKCIICNIRQVCVVIKIIGVSESDEMICTIIWNDTLFHHECHNNDEFIQFWCSKDYSYHIDHDKKR